MRRRRLGLMSSLPVSGFYQFWGVISKWLLEMSSAESPKKFRSAPEIEIQGSDLGPITGVALTQFRSDRAQGVRISPITVWSYHRIQNLTSYI